MLFRNRDKINQLVKEREKDKKLMAICFLFDPYKPEFWYFETVETVRRLAMTGLFSIIASGSFTQLSVGLLFSFAHTLAIGILRPYNEMRDNLLSILSGCQLVLVFMSSSFLKYRNGISDLYDSAGIGAVLLFSYSATFVAFSSWAFLFKGDFSTSNAGMASNVLRGKQGRGGGVEGANMEGSEEDGDNGGDNGGGLFASLSAHFDRFKEARIQKYYDEQYEKKPALQIRDSLGEPPPPPPCEGREQGVEMRNMWSIHGIPGQRVDGKIGRAGGLAGKEKAQGKEKETDRVGIDMRRPSSFGAKNPMHRASSTGLNPL